MKAIKASELKEYDIILNGRWEELVSEVHFCRDDQVKVYIGHECTGTMFFDMDEIVYIRD